MSDQHLLANESFAIPGQNGWKLGGYFATPKTSKTELPVEESIADSDENLEE